MDGMNVFCHSSCLENAIGEYLKVFVGAIKILQQGVVISTIETGVTLGRIWREKMNFEAYYEYLVAILALILTTLCALCYLSKNRVDRREEIDDFYGNMALHDRDRLLPAEGYMAENEICLFLAKFGLF